MILAPRPRDHDEIVLVEPARTLEHRPGDGAVEIEGEAADHLAGRLGEATEFFRQFEPGALLEVARQTQDDLVENLDMALLELRLLLDEQARQPPQSVHPAGGILAGDRILDFIDEGQHAGHAGALLRTLRTRTVKAERQQTLEPRRQIASVALKNLTGREGLAGIEK